MTLPKPIFDAAGLALFLQAHVMRAGALAADLTPDLRANDPARRNAERGERVRLRKAADVSREIFDLALAGKPVMPGHRRRLWLAMGIDPDLRGQGR